MLQKGKMVLGSSEPYSNYSSSSSWKGMSYNAGDGYTFRLLTQDKFRKYVILREIQFPLKSDVCLFGQKMKNETRRKLFRSFKKFEVLIHFNVIY